MSKLAQEVLDNIPSTTMEALLGERFDAGDVTSAKQILSNNGFTIVRDEKNGHLIVKGKNGKVIRLEIKSVET